MSQKIKKYAECIISLYTSGNVAPETEEKVKEWLSDDRFAEEKDEALQQLWGKFNSSETYNTYKSLLETRKRIGLPVPGTSDPENAIRELIGEMGDPALNPAAHSYRIRKTPVGNSGKTLVTPAKRNHTLWVRAAAAAIAAAFIGGTAYLLTHRQASETAAPAPVAEVTVPVSEKQQHLTLADRSDVWINSNTILRYAKDFDSNREVYLDGEAYFAVARTPDHAAFNVRTDQLKLTVLGTEFNVCNHNKENYTTVELFSGNLRVAITATGQTVNLSPNELLIYHHLTREISISPIIGSDNTRSWRLESIDFTNTTLGQIFESLGKIYGMTVETDATFGQNENFIVELRGNESIEEILNVLETISHKFSYSLEADTIKISKTNI